MAKLPSRLPYVRLRQIPGDARLHITERGHTRSGLLNGARVIPRGDMVPLLELLIEEQNSDPTSPELEYLTFRLPDIHAADADALDWALLGDWERGGNGMAAEELKDLLATFRDALNAIPPECGHEDVIEVTTLGDALAQGMCVWCGQRMVAEQRLEVTRGPWKPARD